MDAPLATPGSPPPPRVIDETFTPAPRPLKHPRLTYALCALIVILVIGMIFDVAFGYVDGTLRRRRGLTAT